MQIVEPILSAANQGPDWFCISTGADLGVFHVKQDHESLNQASNAMPSRRAEEIKMVLTSALKDFIASGFASIPEVERVYALRHPREEVVYVRVVLPRSDRVLRDKVYAKEKETIDAFEVFDFDFGIVTASDSIDPTLELVYKKA